MTKLLRRVAQPLHVAALSTVVAVAVLSVISKPAAASEYALAWEGEDPVCTWDRGSECDH